jgi:hypothetical protein
MAAIDSVFDLVTRWQPELLDTELKYRNSLVAFLRTHLKDEVKIKTGYRHSGTTTDVYVKQLGFFGASEVFVELKRNLMQKAQLDRLIGQIHTLQPKKNKILLVLCGETNLALVSRFREQFREPLFSVVGHPVQMGLVVKETAKPTKN